MANKIYNFFHNEENLKTIKRALDAGIILDNPYTISENLKLKGQSFVITGTLENYSRDEASEIIEKFGGKTSGTVSRKTAYVLAGEAAGSKLTKAQDLGIPVITEQEFEEMIK